MISLFSLLSSILKVGLRAFLNADDEVRISRVSRHIVQREREKEKDREWIMRMSELESVGSQWQSSELHRLWLFG